jgi:hypothetical protein
VTAIAAAFGAWHELSEGALEGMRPVAGGRVVAKRTRKGGPAIRSAPEQISHGETVAMQRGEPLDEFLEWVCDTHESVRRARDMLGRERKWGVASVCWEAKLQKIQEEFDKLQFEVSRCVATRDANRLLFEATQEGGAVSRRRFFKRAHSKGNNVVVPFVRATSRTSAS